MGHLTSDLYLKSAFFRGCVAPGGNVGHLTSDFYLKSAFFRGLFAPGGNVGHLTSDFYALIHLESAFFEDFLPPEGTWDT